MKQEEESYIRRTLCLNCYVEQFFPQCSPFRKESLEKKDPKAHVMILYVQGVSKIVARILSHLDVKVHMKPKHTLRSILSRPKDQIPNADKLNVIYQTGCHDCDASYVGETSRTLKTHLSEHKKGVEKADFLALS